MHRSEPSIESHRWERREARKGVKSTSVMSRVAPKVISPASWKTIADRNRMTSLQRMLLMLKARSVAVKG